MKRKNNYDHVFFPVLKRSVQQEWKSEKYGSECNKADEWPDEWPDETAIQIVSFFGFVRFFNVSSHARHGVIVLRTASRVFLAGDPVAVH
jgi:hypothetical protein